MTRFFERGEVWIVALVGLFAFAAIVLIEHVVTPALNPAAHHISEYANGRLGWLMVIGFTAWAVSLAATAVVSRGVRKDGAVGFALIVASLGMLVTASFATQTSAGQLPPGESLTTSGRLHDLGSGVTTLALALAVLLSLRPGESPRLRRLTLLLLLFVMPVVFVLYLVGEDVAGFRQRLLVALACAWQLLLLTKSSPVAGRGST
jgi:hypothetical protein